MSDFDTQDSKTDSKGAGLVLDVLQALCGFAATGATNKELALVVKTSAPQITRCMGTLIDKGWARKNLENGRFYPRPEMAQATYLQVLGDFQRAESRAADLKQAMTAH
jgi:DNA-binding IclR family transcriptional regulator